MEDHFNKNYLKYLSRTSKNLLAWKELTDYAITIICKKIEMAANSSYSDIEINLEELYIQVKTRNLHADSDDWFYSPSEFGLFKTHISNQLESRKINITIDNGIATVCWF